MEEEEEEQEEEEEEEEEDEFDCVDYFDGRFHSFRMLPQVFNERQIWSMIMSSNRFVLSRSGNFELKIWNNLEIKVFFLFFYFFFSFFFLFLSF